MSQDLKQTPIYNEHLRSEGKMVDFTGWSLPISYPMGIIKEHLWVRESVGIFDVSHMGEIMVSGKQAEDFLQWVLSKDIGKLKVGRGIYSLLLTEKGTLIDDLIAYRIGEEKYLLCVNASRVEWDYRWILKQKELKGFDVSVENQSQDWSQIAVQGPASFSILHRSLGIDLTAFKKFDIFPFTIMGDISVWIALTGYTGEKGVEIYLPQEKAVPIWNHILCSDAKVKPIGLGARNTLRLEKGYILYGEDAGEDTYPAWSNLSWAVSPSKDFVGKEALSSPVAQEKKTIGLVMQDRGIVRAGYKVLDIEKNEIGKITSGAYSPSLEKGIAMARVPDSFEGEEIGVEIRGQYARASVKSFPLC